MAVKPCDGLAYAVKDDAASDEEINLVPIETVQGCGPEPAARVGHAGGLVVFLEIERSGKEDSHYSHGDTHSGYGPVEMYVILVSVIGDKLAEGGEATHCRHDREKYEGERHGQR